MRISNKIIHRLSQLTRLLPFVKGEERVLRLIHPGLSPNNIETVIKYDKDLKIKINTASHIEWQIFFKGYYEKEVVGLIKDKLPKGGVFVDVGANIGCHSLIASKIASRAIAIEPMGRARKRLIENVELNNIKNVEVSSFAISDCVGKAKFYAPKDNDRNQGLGSLQKKSDKMEEVEVETTTLDDLLKDEKRVDFIKIDIEGYSKEAIFGAREIIKKFNPYIIYESDDCDELRIF